MLLDGGREIGEGRRGPDQAVARSQASGISDAQPQAKACNIPVRLNLGIAAVLAAAGVFQLFVLPLFLLPASAHWGWLLIPLVLTTNTLWALIHEAIHGLIHPQRRINDLLGRGLCVVIGTPFRIVRLGHLMHHRFNRSHLDRPDVLPEPDQRSPGELVYYYCRILGALYLVEFFASAAALMPKRFVKFLAFAVFGAEAPDGRSMWRAAETQLLGEPGYREMRWDGLWITLIYGAAFWCFGADWWMLALALLGRAFLISFFDNSYHYGTAIDDVLAAYNLKLPRWASAGLLHFNLHAVHHRHPALPWTELRGRFDVEEDRYEGGYLSVALRQLKGPMPDTRFGPRETVQAAE